jgi:hypothetical protein
MFDRCYRNKKRQKKTKKKTKKTKTGCLYEDLEKEI